MRHLCQSNNLNHNWVIKNLLLSVESVWNFRKQSLLEMRLIELAQSLQCGSTGDQSLYPDQRDSFVRFTVKSSIYLPWTGKSIQIVGNRWLISDPRATNLTGSKVYGFEVYHSSTSSPIAVSGDTSEKELWRTFASKNTILLDQAKSSFLVKISEPWKFRKLVRRGRWVVSDT